MARAAHEDALDPFRATLTAALARGVGRGEAREVAYSRASYELARASGAEGARALLELHECALVLRRPLMHRASQSDDTAALAAMMAFEAGLVAPLAQARYVTSSAPHWRAVGARSLTLGETKSGAEHRCDVGFDSCGSAEDTRRRRAGRWRRTLMLDPYAEVRRAALRAAADARDVRDATLVLDAARRDPDPEAREAAIVAAGHIGTVDTVLGLADRWPTASEEARIAIVEAWSIAMRHDASERLACGGAVEQAACIAQRQLWQVAEADSGLPSVFAALSLLDLLSANRASHSSLDAVAFGIASGVVERAIDSAPSRVRVEAITLAPLSQARLLEAVVDSSRSEDAPVAVAALARMIEPGVAVSATEQSQALLALHERARGDGPSSERATQALIAARDEKVLERLARDAKATSPAARRRAADGYAELGRLDEALRLVGDTDGVVRSHAACAILRAPK